MKHIKKIEIKVFEPGATKPRKLVYHAGKGSAFTPNGIEKCLEKQTELIEAAFPSQEFRLVPVGPSAFNFVHSGAKQEVA